MFSCDYYLKSNFPKVERFLIKFSDDKILAMVEIETTSITDQC